MSNQHQSQLSPTASYPTITGQIGLLQAPFVAFLRIFLGVMWLYEVILGQEWKLGTPGSGVNPIWIGSEAGSKVSKDALRAIEDKTLSWFSYFFETVIVPNPEFWSWVVTIMQLALGVLLLVGFLTRPAAIAGLVLGVMIMMIGHTRIITFFVALHLVVLATGAGRFYGLDGWILAKLDSARSGGAKAMRWLIETPLPGGRKMAQFGFAVFAILAVYFLLHIPVMSASRPRLSTQELAATCAIVSIALLAGSRVKDRLGVAMAGLRIYIGFKFLHEIYTRTAPGVQALPGWPDTPALEKVFETLVANHWGFMSGTMEIAFLPAMPVWALIFAVVQGAVGVMLILGYKTRLASVAGLIFLSLLVVLGMTRMPPFFLAMLIPVWALDGGRCISLDRNGVDSKFAPRPTPVISRNLMLGFAGLAVLCLIGAVVAGVEPNGYTKSMRGVSAFIVGLLSGQIALVGWLQQRVEKAVFPASGRQLLGASDAIVSSGSGS
jgi:uncharacterized membrane protein YphA (DoxX/SURF4 family)